MTKKVPFITLAQAKEIAADIPTPFHLYDEKGIRENARRVNDAFSWNKGFKEYFAVKATPNPYLLNHRESLVRGDPALALPLPAVCAEIIGEGGFAGTAA